MRAPHQLVHSRARRRDRFALFPIEGFPTSRIPGWDQTEARILASPALGAGFAMYTMDVAAGGGATRPADGRVETFLFMTDGLATLALGDAEPVTMAEGAFALVPPEVPFSFRTDSGASLVVLRKAYEFLIPGESFQPVVGRTTDVPESPWMGNEHARLQTLIPDELPFDLAMNIFTFDPGYGLPYVETHVMEHGLAFLRGKGVYYLDDEWMEVEAGDFIWMGPFCPQSFYSTGPTPAKYLYYKNVNREIAL
jgi:(S)-ureidoglycine aminohydrolase